MSDARVGDSELLAAHSRELRAFAGRERDVLPRVQGSLARTEQALQARMRHWVRIRDEARESVRRLRAELQACEASDEGGCGGIASALAAAERRLRHAEGEVERSEQGIRRFEAAVREFTPALQRYRGVLDRAVPQASQSLSRHHDQARTYLAQRFAGGGSSGVRGGSATGGPADLTGTSTGGRGAGPGGAARLGGTELWAVPMSSIDLSGSFVQSEGDFQKISPGEVRAGLNRVQEDLLPLAKSGQDPLVARAGPLASAYFGETSIKLSVSSDGRLTPINGEHRLFIAQQMGITEVPARLVTSSGSL